MFVCLYLHFVEVKFCKKPFSAEIKSKDLEEINDDLKNVLEKLQTLRNEGNFR